MHDDYYNVCITITIYMISYEYYITLESCACIYYSLFLLKYAKEASMKYIEEFFL